MTEPNDIINLDFSDIERRIEHYLGTCLEEISYMSRGQLQDLVDKLDQIKWDLGHIEFTEGQKQRLKAFEEFRFASPTGRLIELPKDWFPKFDLTPYQRRFMANNFGIQGEAADRQRVFIVGAAGQLDPWVEAYKVSDEPEPAKKNAPHGPVRKGKGGKARKW